MLEHAPASLLAAVAALAILAPAGAAAARFREHANLRPHGCKQVLSGQTIAMQGCVASAPVAGTRKGTLLLRYSAKVSLARGGGTQKGTLTFRGASKADVLVLRFSGKVTIASGLSRGTWRLVERRGRFARSVPRKGTYVSRTPDQGAHVYFDVRG